MTARATDRRVAVIGGSAAGYHATCLLLAQRNVRVSVFEARRRTTPPARSLIVTHAYRELLGELGEAAVTNEIRRFRLFAGGRTAEVPLEKPDLIIERSALVRSLAEEAERRGASIHTGRRLARMLPHNEGIELEIDDRSVDGQGPERQVVDVVVGADGAFSTVAEQAGFPRQRLLPLVQAIVPMRPDLEPDTSLVWFEPGETPYFFWLIPESEDRAALGVIGTTDGDRTRESLDRFARREGFEPLEYQAGMIPEYTGWTPIHRRLGGGDVYLAGDAAGQVKVTTVGGIVDGVWGAQGVAEAILAGGKTNGTVTALRRELTMHLWIRKLLHGFDDGDYARLLDCLGDGAQSVLRRYSRDEAPRLMVHLLIREPGLLLLGLRGLLAQDGFPSSRPVAGISSR